MLCLIRDHANWNCRSLYHGKMQLIAYLQWKQKFRMSRMNEAVNRMVFFKQKMGLFLTDQGLKKYAGV